MENISFVVVNASEFFLKQNSTISWNPLWAILTGILVIVFGEFVLTLIIKPLDEALKTISKTKKSLGFYARQISAPGTMKKELINEACHFLRTISFKIQYISKDVRFFKLFHFLKLLPSEESLQEAHKELMGLSNSLFEGVTGKDNIEKKEKIEELLS